MAQLCRDAAGRVCAINVVIAPAIEVEMTAYSASYPMIPGKSSFLARAGGRAGRHQY